MLNYLKMIAIMLSFGILLSGCGLQKKWFRDRSEDYKNAESYSKIKVPADVNAEACSQEYQIPE
jgi:uncharacterized lipoprotein